MLLSKPLTPPIRFALVKLVLEKFLEFLMSPISHPRISQINLILSSSLLKLILLTII